MAHMNKRFRDEDGNGQPTDIPDYASAVKFGQRSSPSFKNAWHLWCESNNQQFFDPVRQDQQFVSNFFEALGQGYMSMVKGTGGGAGGNMMMNRNNYASQQPRSSQGFVGQNGRGPGGGGFHKGGGGPGAPAMGVNTANDGPLRKIQELVKMGQRNCQEWKQLWIEWCQQNGNGVQDPARHSSLFILSFVLKFGLASVVGTNWAQPYLVSLGELAKPYMTQTISRGCQESDTWNELWSSFADGKGVNLRDPSKHDAGSLMEFFDMTAMVQFGNEPWMLCYQTGNESEHARS